MRFVVAIVAGFLIALGIVFVRKAGVEARLLAADPACTSPIASTSRTQSTKTVCPTYAGTLESTHVETWYGKYNERNDLYHLDISTDGGSFDISPDDGGDRSMYDEAQRHPGERVALRLFYGRPMLIATSYGVANAGGYLSPNEAIRDGILLVASGAGCCAFALYRVRALRRGRMRRTAEVIRGA